MCGLNAGIEIFEMLRRDVLQSEPVVCVIQKLLARDLVGARP